MKNRRGIILAGFCCQKEREYDGGVTRRGGFTTRSTRCAGGTEAQRKSGEGLPRSRTEEHGVGAGMADAESAVRSGGRTGWPGRRGMITLRCGVKVGCSSLLCCRSNSWDGNESKPL